MATIVAQHVRVALWRRKRVLQSGAFFRLRPFMHGTLDIVLLLLAAAVLVVAIFQQLRLPALLGYLLVGTLIGPHALGLVPALEQTHFLAEFGVVFLMFSLGLDFSLPKLLTMRRVVFGLGTAQVLVTMLLLTAVAVLAGLQWRVAFFISAALAMSSTAILAKMLAERFELRSAHGRQIIGILLLQDLAVIPLLILAPALASGVEGIAFSLLLAGTKAAVVLGLILTFGQRLMRRWFSLVARQKSSELFALNVLFITLGLAWLTGLAGLSLALGAFLAGMLISETEYRYQVEQDIRPFRDVLLGLFFITVGMMLEVRALLDHWPLIVLVLFAVLLIKLAIVVGLACLFGSELSVALKTGFALAGAGEFGLVLLGLAGKAEIVAGPEMQIVLATLIVSMLLSPFLVEHSEQLVRKVGASEWMSRAMELHNIAIRTMETERHVIICGFGRSGQNLARFLEQEEVPYIALDLDPQRVKEAAAAGESVVFGDAARREVLVAAGLMRANALVVSYADTDSALKILHLVHLVRPGLPVVVRTIDDSDIDKLKEAGAAEVVAELLEGSLMLATHALMLLGVPLNRVLRHIRRTREQRYGLFRGFFRGLSDDIGEESDRLQPRLHSVVLPPGAAALGCSLTQLNLGRFNVEVTALRRRNVRSTIPDAALALAENDVIVLRGKQEELALAEMFLLQG
jgi:monovalent cation:H+ antiporter-2, CPA2 family